MNAFKDQELFDTLYRTYARDNFRQQLYFFHKRMGWQTVVGGAELAKRVLDIIVSGTLLLGLMPFFLLIALIIRIESPGSPFFAQTRVGRWGKPFKMYKFRSMVTQAEALLNELKDRNESEAGVIFKIKKDPRITRVGAFIRKTSIDELPQLWNVFKGEMSLVGPRPAIPREVAEYSLDDRRRLDAVPGITCIWQVSGRSDIDFAGQVRLDTRYVESRSFWLDIVLLLKTIPAVLFGKGAY
jgi:lipopolysaccharide/colanic/teichoic acid biosynthesis glycosyltransferase